VEAGEKRIVVRLPGRIGVNIRTNWGLSSMEVLNDGAPTHFVARFEAFVHRSGLRAQRGDNWLTVTWVPSQGLASALIDGERRVVGATPEELFAAVLQVLYATSDR
jgi:hypothetical protein